MLLSKKIFYYIGSSCVILAITMLLYMYEMTRSNTLKRQQADLLNADLQVEQLRKDVLRYEATRAQLGTDSSGSIARHEKVTLSSQFTPADLPRINEFLAHAYDSDGFLLVKNFSYRWSNSDDEKTQKGTTDLKLTLSINGEKIFTR